MPTKSRGFSLIELLTVIAIISVLAAIIFPVYSRARIAAYRSSDISNMNEIRNALQLYRADQGGYPPTLLGYVSPYMSGPIVDVTQVVPAGELKEALYPRRVSSLNTFKPSMAKFTSSQTTQAVWPPQDPRSVGSAPILDLNGDAAITPADDVAQARQRFGPADGYVTIARNTVTPDPDQAANFYQISGYDVAEVTTTTGKRWELRYAPFWTEWGLTLGDSRDDPRQLGYTDPPESTVITWNSYFRSYTDGNVDRGRTDIVLFLGGGARNYESRDASQRSWRVMP